jgi:flagellar motor protein MotB
VVAEEYGEGYLASVSDLMSGLIFIFVITLAVFALQLAKEKETHAEKTRELVAAKDTRKQILKDIEKRLKAAGLVVEIFPEQGVLRLSERGIHFPFGAIDPHHDDEPNVGQLARVLAEVLPCYVAGHGVHGTPERSSDRPGYCAKTLASAEEYQCDREAFPARLETVLIEGHTDNTPVRAGTRLKTFGNSHDLDNRDLSSMRAAGILAMLAKCEPGLTELRNTEELPVIGTSGYGESRPVSEKAEENRRIDLRFLMETPQATAPTTASPAADALAPRRAVREGYGP